MVNVLAARPSSRLLKKPCGTANPGCAWKIKAIDSALVPEIVRHNLLGIDFFSSLLRLHPGLQAGFHRRPFRIQDAEVNGVADAASGSDHVIAEGAFLARADAQNGIAR